MKNCKFFVFGIIFLIIAMISSCNSGKDQETEDNLSLSTIVANTPGSEIRDMDYEDYSELRLPPLPPDEALKKFELEEGFRIEIVASEPMIADPIAMDIDSDGRLWVIDMPSYMPVHDKGTLETAALERVPEARVTVLEDTTGDGKMDVQRIFYEGLILPRAIKVLTDGILVAEPPNVLYIRDTNGDGKGDTREVVYNGYGDETEPNIHSFPGGLMWGMDNWLHSSNNNVESIRQVDGEWKTLPFRRLGQWGMSQDNFGRLYSSNNAKPLQTHLVPYGYSSRHPMFEVTEGKNVSIGGDTIWPAHYAGVNRGYREGVLREDSTLIRATAASSTVIYRGDQFGEDYVGNAFSPEPGANLIKRYIIDSNPADIDATADYAYRGREFLTSTDERFRPVNIYNSPDGSIYVLDMYRGLLEHASHLTDYLRDYVVKRDLHIPAGGQFGRIYRIVRDDRDINYDVPKFSEMKPKEWVSYLRHENGHLRDQAQQVLVQTSPGEVVPMLENLVQDQSVEPYTRLHALWTLEGFEKSVYKFDNLIETALQALDDQHPRVRAAAVRILEPAMVENNKKLMERLSTLPKNESSEYVQLQLLASLGESRDDSVLELMAEILNNNINNVYFREMALTGVYQREGKFANILRDRHWGEASGEEYDFVLKTLDDATLQNIELADISELSEGEKELFEAGKRRYTTCMACHGSQGEGMDGVGPRLSDSDWVQGNEEALARIVLHGFTGAAAERGEDFAGVMPGHAWLSDEDLASVLTYIRQSFGNNASPVDPENIKRIREETKGRSELWTPNELR